MGLRYAVSPEAMEVETHGAVDVVELAFAGDKSRRCNTKLSCFGRCHWHLTVSRAVSGGD